MNNMWLVILKFVCLVVGVAYGFSNIVKALIIVSGQKGKISEFQVFAMAINIVGFIFLQFKLYM